MIWKFNNTETYLLGSIHALPEKNNIHSDSINKVYNKVEKIVFECSFDDTVPPICFYKKDKLSEMLSKTLFREVKKEWLRYKLPYEDLEKSKIWNAAFSIASKILEKHGMFIQNGIDRIIWEKSKRDNKTIKLLEPIEESLSYFDTAPIEEQRKMLSQVVRRKNKVVDQVKTIIEGWSIGDEKSLSSVLQLFIEHAPIMYNNLIVERNKLWLDLFLSAFRSNVPTLFVVGVLHCVDLCSIQNLAKNLPDGYDSEIINI